MRETILQETSVEQHRQQVIEMIYGFVSTLYKQEG